jgi:hypothetical protein
MIQPLTIYTDYTGRKLQVIEVNPGDPLGREVVGGLVMENGMLQAYATTLAIAESIWVQRQPPTSREQQEANRKKLGV